jgi:chemotaxis protein histidine kinase CheA
MKTKSAYVYSGALAVALLAFSFNLGTTNAVRADELVELTPATETMVLNVGLSASEAISACTAEVVAEFCECPVTVVQAAAEPSEAKDDTPVIEAAAEPAEVDAAPPGSEAAAEPEIPEAAVETIPSEAAAEPVEAAATETEPTLTTAAAAEPAADSDEVEHTGSLPNTGAAIIWYPEVEVSIP